MNDGAVSVVVPTWNRCEVLPRALGSALNQLRPGDEIIVVDDGSTDGTRGLLARYEPPVRAIFTPNGGAGAARNAGIAEARNPLVAFLDSDDEWMPGSLEARRRLLAARPDVLFCFSDFAISLPDGRTVRRYLPHWHQDPRSWKELLGPGVPLGQLAGDDAPLAAAQVHVGDLYAHEMHANYVLTSSFLVRREEAGDTLRFEPGLANGEDWACFGRVARRGLGAYLDAETCWQHGDSEQRISCHTELSFAVGRLQVLERVWGRDAEFLATAGRSYTDELRAARERHVRALLAAGRSQEARTALRALDPAPRMLRMLSALPRPVLETALAARSLARTVTGAERRARAQWEESLADVGPDEPAQDASTR